MNNYTKTIWNDSSRITADKMNKIESQLDILTSEQTNVQQKLSSDIEQVNQKVQSLSKHDLYAGAHSVLFGELRDKIAQLELRVQELESNISSKTKKK